MDREGNESHTSPPMERIKIRTGSLKNNKDDGKEAAAASHQPMASGAAGSAAGKTKAKACCLAVPLTSESCFEKFCTFFLSQLSPGETLLPVALLQNKVTCGMFGSYLENSGRVSPERETPIQSLKGPTFCQIHFTKYFLPAVGVSVRDLNRKDKS